jgi:hypothetical protein
MRFSARIVNVEDLRKAARHRLRRLYLVTLTAELKTR